MRSDGHVRSPNELFTVRSVYQAAELSMAPSQQQHHRQETQIPAASGIDISCRLQTLSRGIRRAALSCSIAGRSAADKSNLRSASFWSAGGYAWAVPYVI